MMREAQTVGEAFGIRFRLSIEKRIAGAESIGAHKTSMLQDIEHGRAIEIDALLGSVIELAASSMSPTRILTRSMRSTKLLGETVVGSGSGLSLTSAESLFGVDEDMSADRTLKASSRRAATTRSPSPRVSAPPLSYGALRALDRSHGPLAERSRRRPRRSRRDRVAERTRNGDGVSFRRVRARPRRRSIPPIARTNLSSTSRTSRPRR